MTNWRTRVTLTAPQIRALQRYYSAPINIDLKSLPPVVRRTEIMQIEKRSYLGPRRTRTPEWSRKNSLLLGKAKNGDERAFLELIARDPQYLCSDLGLLFVCQWQLQLNSLYSMAGDDPDFLAEVKRHPAHVGLERISQMLLKPFDRRGKRSLPREEVVKICYYGALTLFSGLKRLSLKHAPRSPVAWVGRMRTRINQISASEIPMDSHREGFFQYIQHVNAIVSSDWPQEFTSPDIVSTPPNLLATHFVGMHLKIQERTMRQLLKGHAVIAWIHGGKTFGVMKPNLKLEDYQPVRKLLGTK